MLNGSTRSILKKGLLPLLFATLMVAPLHGELARVGAVTADPRVGGFPAWYQDKTGLTLEFCAPQSQPEVDGGWCLLLTGDVNPPESFPTNFFDEHFYFAADSALTAFNGGKANLVLAVESAFAGGPAKVGDQITFARIRVRLSNVPMTGTYRVIHPYGEDLIDAVAGDRIFFTEDFGVGAGGGPFDTLLTGRLGPFLLPSDRPGGTEMPPVTAQNPTPDRDPAHFGGGTPTPYPGTGKTYIADPARLGPVTGSTLAEFLDSTGNLRNHNIFRIEGPAGSDLGGPGVDFIETTDFTLVGRVFTGGIPGRVTVDRASYERDNSSEKYDVFATAFPTAPGRIPGQPTPPAVMPDLSFFGAPCNTATDSDGNPVPPYSAPSGAAELQMFNSGSTSWGQSTGAVPSGVCVKDSAARDANGNPVAAYFPANVVDEVTIDSATYNPGSGTLTVTAHSSDEATPPVLTLMTFGKTPDTNLTGNTVSITQLGAPPAVVRVHSARGGQSELAVKTGVGKPQPGTPVAVNDAATMVEDSTGTSIDVLANDTVPQGSTPSISITALPRLGTAIVDTNNKITYTPNANASGSDTFSYTVSDGTAVSNTASVTVSITPVNDDPVAANDNFAAIANRASTFNLLSNDSDPDGASDLSSVTNITAPTGPGTATITPGTGGSITFTATAAGTYTFSYQAKDAAGATSPAATVTVTVAAGEQIAIAQAEFRTGSLRLRISGTISPVAGQTVTIKWASGTDTSTVVATATSDGTGAWAIDLRNVSGIQDPRRSGATSVIVTGPGGGSRGLNLTIRN